MNWKTAFDRVPLVPLVSWASLGWTLFLVTTPLDAQAPQRTEARTIRRAYLDVLELLPTPQEVDWYIIYNQNGYVLATEYLSQKGGEGVWSLEKLRAAEYVNGPEQPVERAVLEKNIVYLAGLWKGELTPELFETSCEKFIRDSLETASENIDDTIDWMINLLTCRPSSAAEENELSGIYRKVSLKSSELDAWKTVLLHILELHDCKFK